MTSDAVLTYCSFCRDEDPVGIWTLRVRDRQNNGKRGVFQAFSLALWGSSIDPALAKPYRLPVEGGGDEYEAIETETETVEPVPSTTMPIVAVETTKTQPTKTHVKPTAHLPGDHGDVTGEAHSSFADGYHTPAPTETAAISEPAELDDIQGSYLVPSTTPITDSLYDATPGYLAGISALVGSTTWLFVAAGTIIVFIAGATAFFLLRRRSARRGGAGRGGYAFAPATDFEDYDEDDDELVPMSAMERGRVRLGGTGRTRELFNAFALDSEEEEEEEEDADHSDAEGDRRQAPRSARASAEEIEGVEKGLLDDTVGSQLASQGYGWAMGALADACYPCRTTERLHLRNESGEQEKTFPTKGAGPGAVDAG